MRSEVKFIFILAIINHLAALNPLNDVEGKDCAVVEPIRNYTFNLKDLKSDFGYHINSYDQPEKFTFNVCGPLSRKCNNQEAGACVKLPSGQELVFGFQDKLFWNDGSIRFSYVGEKCNATANYTMDVMLHCDYSGTKKDFLGAFHESGKCDAQIFMQTPLACLPATENLEKTNCLVKSPKGDVFNFQSLRNYNHKIDGKNGKSFVIGVCNPVLYGHEAACEAGASVCMVDSNAKDLKDKYKSLGFMTQDFKYEDNYIGLTMTSKEKCGVNETYVSEIMFECDELAKVSYPTHQVTIGCSHVFSWPTQLACADKKVCQVSNVDTGVSFDFSTLAKVQYEAVNANNTDEKILFSVCSPAEEPCMKNSGSCVVKKTNNQSTQAGIVNSDLKLNGKNPYLLYENGAICKKIGSKFSTRIDFICADSPSDEGAVAIEDGCDITIHFKTMLACDFIKNCMTKSNNDEEIDLRPLIDFDGNYVANVNKTNLPKESAPVQYLLNVCRPLNSKYSLNCRGSSGACRTELETDGKHEKEMSLGHPDYSLTTKKVRDTNEVTMKYFDGAKCPTDPSENATTKIRFYCDETVGLGNPILQSIENCEYSFDFPTNILCNELNVEIQNGTCSLVNPHTSVSMDLKLFGTDGVYKVGDKEVNICGGSGEKLYTIVYKQSMVRIEFVQGTGKDKYDVAVQLKCGTNSTKTTSVHDDIHMVMHESPLICPLLKIIPKASNVEPPSDDHHADESKAKPASSGFTLGYAFLVSVVILAFVAFYLVYRNPERREIIRNLIKFRSTGSPVQYSRVGLNEESLLLNNNIASLSDSDDDNILL